MLRSLTGLVLLPVLAVGCPEPPNPNDLDQDGFESADAGGRDCDDTDPTIHPNAADAWYDGIDSNCDGRSDFDADSDGVDRSPQGLDCDDENPAVPGPSLEYPGGPDFDCDGEVAWDGLPDQPVEVQVRGPLRRLGHDRWAGLGLVPHVFVGSRDAIDGWWTLDHPARTLAASPAGDLVAVGNPTSGPGEAGVVTLARPDDGAVLATMRGGTRDWVGASVAFLDDFDGDDLPDLAVGAPAGVYGDDPGQIRVFSDAHGLSGEVPLDRAQVVLGGTRRAHLGTVIADGGDINGDGLSDLIIGHPQWNRDTGQGAVFLLGGTPDRLTGDAWRHSLRVDGQGRSSFGNGAASPGDLDGDGYGDFMVCAPVIRTGAELETGVSFHRGAADLAETIPHAEARVLLVHAQFGGGCEIAVDVDLDGDGFADTVVGAPHNGAGPGGLMLFSGADAVDGGAIEVQTLVFDADEHASLGEGVVTLPGEGGLGVVLVTGRTWEGGAVLVLGRGL